MFQGSLEEVNMSAEQALQHTLDNLDRRIPTLHTGSIKKYQPSVTVAKAMPADINRLQCADSRISRSAQQHSHVNATRHRCHGHRPEHLGV